MHRYSSVLAFTALTVGCLLLSSPDTRAGQGTVAAQGTMAARGKAPYSLSEPATDAVLPVQRVAVLELEAIEPEHLLAEDRAKGGYDAAEPLRYAAARQVDVTPDSHGTWEQLPGGARLWRLHLHAPGATDLYAGFDEFRLPPGATLHLLAADGYYRGPYSSSDKRPHGKLWTPVVPGEWATLELYLPAAPAFTPELHLSEVGRGYRDLFRRSRDEAKLDGDQGDCNIDVICPEGDDWRDEIRSVALYTVGPHLCTGTLIMNAAADFRNLFLAAYHCGITESNAAIMVFYWEYESPECGMLGNGSLDNTQSGATFLATRQDVDFTLVELDEDPRHDVYYSGWDATGDVPQGSVAIHHPRGGEKAISFNDDPLTTGPSCIGVPSAATHWYVDNWEQGTTEKGSSGCGLWDPASHRFVGWLSGGDASCELLLHDCFGKLSAGWDGPSPATRLRDWLDPTSSGTSSVDGANPAPIVRYSSHQARDVCWDGNGGGNGIWEPGELLLLDVELSSRGNFTGLSGTLSSSTPGVVIDNPEGSWPDLVWGSTVRNDAPFVVHLPQSLACYGAPVVFDLQVSGAGGEQFALSFSHDLGSQLAPIDLPQTIPRDGDLSTVSSQLLAGEDVTLTDLDVFVHIDHDYVGDLIISLRSPSGTSVTLLDRPGVPANSWGCNDDDLEITFDDDAEMASLESHCAGTTPWYSGSARPVEPLAALLGEPTAGTWTLVVQDAAAGDGGVLQSWGIVSQPELAGQCSVCTLPDVIPRRVGGRRAGGA